MSRKRYNHTHQYQVLSSSTEFKIFRCVKPDCVHSIHRDYLIGRRAECKYCGLIFTIKAEHLKRKDVWCLDCNKKENKKITYDIPTVTEQITKKDENVFANLLKGSK